VADPTLLTGVIGTVAGVIGTTFAVYTARREKVKDDENDDEQRAAGSVASWTALNAALDREIRRMHEEMDRLRDEYERHLQAARNRITELEGEVATLKRLLRGEQPG
jgi:uncharacterized protein involved in exopolysaccharide biosynthesis